MDQRGRQTGSAVTSTATHWAACMAMTSRCRCRPECRQHRQTRSVRTGRETNLWEGPFLQGGPAPPLPAPLAPADEPQQPVNRLELQRGAGSSQGETPTLGRPLMVSDPGWLQKGPDSPRPGGPREHEDPWLRPVSRQASIIAAFVLKVLKNGFTSFLTFKTQTRITNRFQRFVGTGEKAHFYRILNYVLFSPSKRCCSQHVYHSLCRITGTWKVSIFSFHLLGIKLMHISRRGNWEQAGEGRAQDRRARPWGAGCGWDLVPPDPRPPAFRADVPLCIDTRLCAVLPLGRVAASRAQLMTDSHVTGRRPCGPCPWDVGQRCRLHHRSSQLTLRPPPGRTAPRQRWWQDEVEGLNATCWL